MKKRRKLKNWAEYTLVGINFTSLLFMGGDAEDLKVFIIGHLIALVVFLLSGYALIKNIND